MNCKTEPMKAILLTISFFMASLLTISAQEKETFTLTIEVSITKYDKGSILLALYNSKENYMEKTYRSSNVSVKDKKAVILFENIEKGSYGFSFFHDVNDNKKLDTNFVGIPKEPYGFSNNQKGTFGPPKYEAVAFEVNENKTITLRIK